MYVRMSGLKQKLYILSLAVTIISIFILIGAYGADYYLSEITERFDHPKHELFKPSGLIGHGIGILGSLMMLIGVFAYMARKRLRSLSRLGVLKHWLEFHIFLCTLGPILVLYHTSFKFGGLVAISFWSMVAVVLSGIVGRFIYLQIPRTIQGRVYSLNELAIQKANIHNKIQKQFKLDDAFMRFLNQPSFTEEELHRETFFRRIIYRVTIERRQVKTLKTELKKRNIDKKDQGKIRKLLHAEIVLVRRIAWLSTMQKYMQYWHVLHLPFALTMLVIMIVHIAVAVLFGYTWLF